MAAYSDDEWCIVSEGDERVSTSSSVAEEIEMEPEPELVPRISLSTHIKPLGCSKTIELDASELLPDETLSRRETAAMYSRDIRLSLLSPMHQPRFASATTTSPPSVWDCYKSKKRSVKVAFLAGSTRGDSFPDRFRAEMPSRRATSETEASLPPTFTPVDAFVCDQGSQTTNTVEEPTRFDGNRTSRFQSALERSLTLTMQLKSKCQDYERLLMRNNQLEARIADSESEKSQDAKQLRLYQRGMAIMRDRLATATEFQEHQASVIKDLKTQNQSLERQNAVLSGRERDLSNQSVIKLEALEFALSRGMDNVRAALRAKYRAAIEQSGAAASSPDEDDESCVVCLAKPATVQLIPCKHQVVCPACAIRVDTCPIDRLDIEDKVLTFGLNAYAD